MDNKPKFKLSTKLLIAIIIIFLVCAAFGFGFGFGNGGGPSGTSGGGTLASDSLNSVQSPLLSASVSPSASAEPKYVITVSGKNIIYNGAACTLDELKTAVLEGYSGTDVYELHDGHAIKAVYDSVKTLLDELDIKYTEK